MRAREMAKYSIWLKTFAFSRAPVRMGGLEQMKVPRQEKKMTG